ncbi:MAG: cupin domain-containing protein [Spirochaetes bacterium]|nr:cupin domain-containing protein [Spirochaetota bacterium]
MNNSFINPQNYCDAIDYQNNAIVSKTIIQSKGGNITLFAFDKGQSLSEHTAPYDAFVMILDGAMSITIGGKENTVNAGQALIMPANVPHALVAHKSSKMLLVMIKES